METGIGDSTRGLDLAITWRDGAATIRVAGRLVAGGGADHPAWALPREVDRAARTVIDVQGVTALDAAGVGRLVNVRQRLVALGGSVVIAAAPPRVRRVLQLTRLDATFGLASSSGGGHPTVRQGHGHAGPLCRCA